MTPARKPLELQIGLELDTQALAGSSLTSFLAGVIVGMIAQRGDPITLLGSPQP